MYSVYSILAVLELWELEIFVIYIKQKIIHDFQENEIDTI